MQSLLAGSRPKVPRLFLLKQNQIRIRRRITMKQIRLVFALTVCSLLTSLAAAQVLPSNATNFPMIGITRSQTLQLNLVAFPVDPCFAQLGFQNSSGNPVGTTLSVTLQPGQSASLAINGNSLTNTFGQRVEILPCHTVLPDAGIVSSCQASAECMTMCSEHDQRAGARRSRLSPQPGAGDVGRYGLADGAAECGGLPYRPLHWADQFSRQQRNLIGNSLMNVNLSPGQAMFLDLPGSIVVTKLGQRAEVQPVVTPSPSSGPNVCVASAEVYYNGLGTTSAYYPTDPCGPSSTSCAVF